MTDEAAVATETAPEAPPAAVPESAAAAPAAPESVEALPDWTQKMIRDLRSEAAANRTKATTAEQAKQETMDAIAKALGLKGDDDPAKAAQTAAEERDAATGKASALARELAITRAAIKAGVDPETLTDSRSFMAKTEPLDPAADDFAAQVEAAVKDAVEKNPLLKAAAPAAPPARSGGPVGGGAPVAGQLTAADLKTMTPAEIVKAQEEGRCNTLLGITQ